MGSSELMTNLSSSVVNALYNMQLMKFAGEDGVAAYGTIMYVNFIFVSIFLVMRLEVPHDRQLSLRCQQSG